MNGLSEVVGLVVLHELVHKLGAQAASLHLGAQATRAPEESTVGREPSKQAPFEGSEFRVTPVHYLRRGKSRHRALMDEA